MSTPCVYRAYTYTHTPHKGVVMGKAIARVLIPILLMNTLLVCAIVIAILGNDSIFLSLSVPLSKDN